MDSQLRKTGEEENNTDQSTCPKKFRKTSSSSSNCYIESLPADVMFEILVRVPAQDVHNSARLVCRSWRRIISTRDFKLAHLHRSTCGLLAQELYQLIETGSKADDVIEISKLRFRSQHKVLSSCNGLLLEARKYNLRALHIRNPATEQILVLPGSLSVSVLAMEYAAATMEYKVVRSPIRPRKSQDNCVAILTVGVDKDWTRRVDTEHLSRKAKKLLLEKFPLTTRGFVHWARDEGRPGYVLTLNVETEIITQFPVPSLRCHHENGFYKEVIYLPMGSYLSLLVLRSEFSWEFWEMKPESGEWTEMPSIDLEAQFATSSTSDNILTPVGWLTPREVLVFSVGERVEHPRYFSYSPTPFCFAFTVGTSKLQKFKLDKWVNRCLVHRNSLVWVDGC